MTIDPVRAECFEKERGDKGFYLRSPLDPPVKRPFDGIRRPLMPRYTHRERERVLLGNVNRDTDVDKWGIGPSLYSVASRCCSS